MSGEGKTCFPRFVFLSGSKCSLPYLLTYCLKEEEKTFWSVQVVRGNPASRGTETSAGEVTVK